MLFYLAIVYLVLAAVVGGAILHITLAELPYSPCRTSRALSQAVLCACGVVIVWSVYGLWLAVSSPALTG